MQMIRTIALQTTPESAGMGKGTKELRQGEMEERRAWGKRVEEREVRAERRGKGLGRERD